MPAWCTGALLVYDTTDAESFRRVAKWVEELQVAVRRLKKFHTQLLTFIGFLGSLRIWRALSVFWPSLATSVTCNHRQRFVQQWCYVLVLADPEIVRVECVTGTCPQSGCWDICQDQSPDKYICFASFNRGMLMLMLRMAGASMPGTAWFGPWQSWEVFSSMLDPWGVLNPLWGFGKARTWSGGLWG